MEIDSQPAEIKPEASPEAKIDKNDHERLPPGNYLKEVGRGIGVLLGLGLLWGLEIVRNAYFRALDRIGVKPRTRRSSAFPPGQPKKHTAIQS
ncbi:MAG TPA: hypothetical protein VMV13_03170 [Candidatus Binataceae bacterium]|nr:hypothetical protein [Candidatus Binataceae bacterium]